MSSKPELLYGKMNYILIAVGAVLVALGFILMSGGGAELGPDGYAHEFDGDGIFSFRRLTLAPIVIVAGFITVAVAILKKFKQA